MKTGPIDILLVEDNPVDVELLRKSLFKRNTDYLADVEFNLVQVTTVSEAMSVVLERPFDVILLDLALPDSYGLSALVALQKVAPRIPIVVITGVPDEDMALQIIDLGAQDYLFKGECNRHQLIRSIYYAIDRQCHNEALKSSEMRFRASVEGMMDGFIIFSALRDPTGRIYDFKCEFINEAGCRQMSTTREALLGKRLLEVETHHQVTDMFKEYAKVVETGVPLVKDIVSYDDMWGGNRLQQAFDVRVARLGDGFASIWRDITDQRKASHSITTHASQLAALYQTALEITSEMDVKTLLSSIVERAVKLTGTSMGGLYLVTPNQEKIELSVVYNIPEKYLGTQLALGEGLSGMIAQTGESMWIEDYQSWSGHAAAYMDAGFKRVFGVPLKVSGKVIGVINITDSSRTGKFSEEQINLAKLFADQAAIAIDNARLHTELRQLAITDELTGLYNRRGLFQIGNREVERSLRFGHPLAALMIDIDHFKEVNDQHGHVAGDQVLKTFSERLRDNLRGLDILARYGGDEFVILLLENDLVEAVQVGERLRRAIVNLPFSVNGLDIKISISLGATQVNQNTLDLSKLVERVDKALYLAKQSGRNCIVPL